MQFKNSFVVILLTLILSACATGRKSTPTPVALWEQNQPQAQFAAAQTPSPVPFQFRLPTPGAEPVSGWRPPLYPIPLALSPYDHFYFARPIAADQVNWPIPDYRYGGIFFGPNTVHTGIDIPTPEGTPIMAAGAGTVVWAGWGLFSGLETNQDDDYGLAVAIRHDFGYQNQKLYTIYAHMSKVIARLDQHVETGDVIGLVGSTGKATGPHVHFEVRLQNNTFFYTYNPELWIAPPQGWGVLVGRVMDAKEKTLQQVEVQLESVETEKSYLVKTYGGGGAINRDPYYNENVALSDLPAGFYKITINYEKKKYQTWVEIFAGQTTYFAFAGGKGFNLTRPPAPTLKALPEVLPATPTSIP